MPLVIENSKLYENCDGIRDALLAWRGKYGGYIPTINNPNWPEIVQEAHQDLRGILDGIRKTGQIRLIGSQKPAEYSDCLEIIKDILYYVPNYLIDNNLQKEVFLTPYHQNGTKVGKHVLQYCNEYYGYIPERIKQLEVLLAKLGKEWAKTKTRDVDLYYTISTACKAFALIGHYGPDNVSCFKQSSGSPAKYTLGTIKNTFVVLIRDCDSNTFEPENSPHTLARLWGFHNPKDNAVSFCNYYPRPSFPIGDTTEILKNIASDILGLDTKNIASANNMIRVPEELLIFHNKRTSQLNIIYYPKGNKIDVQVLGN